MSLARPCGWDITPSTYRVGGCARVALNTSALVFGVFVLWTAAKDCSAVVAPDPKLLRAACASKVSADAGRRVLSMTSIPRGSSIVREIAASTEAELRAWADVEVVCP